MLTILRDFTYIYTFKGDFLQSTIEKDIPTLYMNIPLLKLCNTNVSKLFWFVPGLIKYLDLLTMAANL